MEKNSTTKQVLVVKSGTHPLSFLYRGRGWRSGGGGGNDRRKRKCSRFSKLLILLVLTLGDGAEYMVGYKGKSEHVQFRGKHDGGGGSPGHAH